MSIHWLADAAPEEAFAGKRVFCRVDFNVPLNEEGGILDDSRIKAALPTLIWLLKHKVRLIIGSHLGRPKGKPKIGLSLEPVAQRLSELLDQEVVLAEDCVGEGIKRHTLDMSPGRILMLENLRFHSGEEKNDAVFSKLLAQLCDIYVNDAFGSVHRAHASVHGITFHVPSCYGGFLLQKEVEALAQLRQNPLRPYAAILGGSKVSDKIGILGELLNKTDTILIGGAMAYTFLKAKGENIGASRFEEDRLTLASAILKKTAASGPELLLPIDHVAAESFDKHASHRVVASNEFGAHEIGLDIGPATRELFAKALSKPQTVFWNGPMGVYEWANFSEGTTAVAQAVSKSSGFTVVGGGDSIAALHKAGLSDHISHISTGGGASLEFLEGETLPGLEALGYEF